MIPRISLPLVEAMNGLDDFGSMSICPSIDGGVYSLTAEV